VRASQDGTIKTILLGPSYTIHLPQHITGLFSDKKVKHMKHKKTIIPTTRRSNSEISNSFIDYALVVFLHFRDKKYIQ